MWSKRILWNAIIIIPYYQLSLIFYENLYINEYLRWFKTMWKEIYNPLCVVWQIILNSLKYVNADSLIFQPKKKNKQTKYIVLFHFSHNTFDIIVLFL